MKKNALVEVSEQLAGLLSAIASPQRIAIVLAIGNGEACVCHLEAALGWRQANISQHLMALRKANILQDRRDGRYVYYKLRNVALLHLLVNSAPLSGLSSEAISALIDLSASPSCECPQCASVVIAASSL